MFNPKARLLPKDPSLFMLTPEKFDLAPTALWLRGSVAS
jgi:hypothetical protein